MDLVLFAELLVHADGCVSAAHLVEAIWPGRASTQPANPVNAVQVRVSRLRRWLRRVDPAAADTIRTSPQGYRLEVGTDAERFRALVREARRAREPQRAFDGLRAALELWRGQPFEGLSQTACVTEAAGQLTESYLAAVEEFAEVSLADGDGTGELARLGELVAAHPLRERLRAAYMLALAQAGQQAAALAVYQEGRDRLVVDLGIEPSSVLQEAHSRVLRKAVPGRKPEGREFLPRDIVSFAGREAELALLEAETPPAVAIWTVDGMAGVGKSALAVHAAHRLGSRYPDGRFYLDLRGHSPGEPMGTDEALDVLLNMSGGSGEPTNWLPDRTARWRARLATGRTLLVLDNAASAEQVRPLLPGSGSVLVLVTSRRRLVDLEGARPLSLDVLPHHSAVECFSRSVGDRRPLDEPDAVDEVVRMCGMLPLAIEVVGARLRHRPRWTVADIALRLSDESRRLYELDTAGWGVLSSFGESLRRLTTEQARLFRLLGLAPRGVFGPDVADVLFGFPDRAHRLLEELVDVHLLRTEAVGRYRLHDLVRRYALRLATELETPETLRIARRRIIAHRAASPAW